MEKKHKQKKSLNKGVIDGVKIEKMFLLANMLGESLLSIAKDAFGAVLKTPCGQTCKKTATAKECKKKSSTLSEAEAKKVRSLRNKGLSIKAIGKAIHRAERVVADYVRTLPKK